MIFGKIKKHNGKTRNESDFCKPDNELLKSTDHNSDSAITKNKKTGINNSFEKFFCLFLIFKIENTKKSIVAKLTKIFCNGRVDNTIDKRIKESFVILNISLFFKAFFSKNLMVEFIK